jgi:transcriptional regulator with XRE-family HTH domain
MKVRKIRGKALAAMTEIQESQISRYKNGVRAKIQVEDVDNICNALNISRVWLLYGQGPMEPSEADEFAQRVLELANAFGKRS